VGWPSLVPRPLLDPSQFFREGSGYETRGGHGCPGHTYGAGPGLCYVQDAVQQTGPLPQLLLFQETELLLRSSDQYLHPVELKDAK